MCARSNLTFAHGHHARVDGKTAGEAQHLDALWKSSRARVVPVAQVAAARGFMMANPRATKLAPGVTRERFEFQEHRAIQHRT